MRKSQFIFVLMLSTSFVTMVRADDTSYANCVAAVGVDNCEQIGTSGTYYALSGDKRNKTMTIYGTNADGTAATVPENAFLATNWASTFPEGVTSLKTSGNVNIGEGGFYDAWSLTSVDLTGVKIIGDYAFDRTHLTGHLDLTGVQTIGESAFYGATGLTGHLDLTSVQSIGNSAFYRTGLTSVDLTGVQTIGDGAFSNTGLTGHLDLTGVQTIGERAFGGATGLTGHLDLTGVQSIGRFAFSATGLTSIVISDSLLDSNGNITGIDTKAFYRSGLNTIYCPTDKTCGNSFTDLSGTPDIISYTKDAQTGIYKADGKTYASSEDMQKGPDFACTTDCAERVAAYKNAKAASMAGSSLCATQQECLNLMNMVDDSDYTCTTIAACSAYAKDPQNNITLASLYPQLGGTGGNEVQPQKLARKSMLIYTIEEATKLSKDTGNTIKLRYK